MQARRQAVFEQLETLIAAEPVADQPNYRAVQIKEKFGGLRVYLALAGTPEMEKAISEAEAESFRTCDVCGKPGKGISIRGWMLTRCDEHRS